MTAWTEDELARIGTAEELEIASLRRDDTLGMTALAYGIVRSADTGWSDPLTVAALAAGVLLLALALAVVVAVIVAPRTAAEVADSSVSA
jgi:hypothetical protein